MDAPWICLNERHNPPETKSTLSLTMRLQWYHSEIKRITKHITYGNTSSHAKIYIIYHYIIFDVYWWKKKHILIINLSVDILSCQGNLNEDHLHHLPDSGFAKGVDACISVGISICIRLETWWSQGFSNWLWQDMGRSIVMGVAGVTLLAGWTNPSCK